MFIVLLYILSNPKSYSLTRWLVHVILLLHPGLSVDAEALHSRIRVRLWSKNNLGSNTKVTSSQLGWSIDLGPFTTTFWATVFSSINWGTNNPSQYGGKDNMGNVCKVFRSSVVHFIKSVLNNYNYYYLHFQWNVGQWEKSHVHKGTCQVIVSPEGAGVPQTNKQTNKQAHQPHCLVWKSVYLLASSFYLGLLKPWGNFLCTR